MKAGLIQAVDLLFTLNWSFSGNQAQTSNAVLNGARLDCVYANTYSEWTTGLAMHVSANTAAPGSPFPTAKTTLTFIYNGAQTIYTLASSYLASGTVTAEITNAKFYSKGTNGWLLTFDSLVVNGPSGEITTITDGSITSLFLAPCGIPLIGFPCMIGCSGGSGITPVVGAAPIYSSSFTLNQTATSAASGGWQIRPTGGTYQSLAVNVDFVTPPTCTSYAPDPGCPAPTATSTNNASVSASYSINTVAVANTSTTVTFVNNSCDVMLIPDLTKVVKRLNSVGSAALIYRYAFPQSSTSVSSNNVNLLTSTTTCNETSYSHPNVGESDFLGTCRQSTHAMEDVFSKHSYAIYDSSGTSWKAYGLPAGVQQAEELTRASSFLGIMDADWTGNYFNSMTFEPVPSVDKYGAWGKYLNTWCAPHWNYMPYFPPDSENDSNSWPLDGSAEAPSDYWVPIRSQWLHNSALPPADGTDTRTDLCTTPLGAASPGLWARGGAWGISNFQVRSVTIKTAYTYTASTSSLWSCDNGTIAFGITLTVTPSSVGTVTVSLSLASFTKAPYLLPAVCYEFAVSGYTGSNITSATAQLVGQDGAIVQLGNLSDSPFTPYQVPDTTNIKYVGSWGQDFGAGATIHDSGSDALPNGISVPSMASPLYSCDTEMLTMGNAQMIQFVFEVNSTAAFTMNFPTITSASPPTYISETAMSGSYVFSKGNLVRVGQQRWTSGGAMLTSPTEILLGDKQTVADAIATSLVLFEEASPSTVPSIISGMYDAVEGNTIADVESGTYAHFIHAGGVQKHPMVIMVNGLAEAPPSASLPTLTHNPLTMLPTTTYGQESWDYSCEPRFLVSPIDQSDLYQPGTPPTVWTSDSTVNVTGWSIRWHTHAVTNSEDKTFLVQLNNKTYGLVSPWHGYVWSGGTLIRAVAYDVSNAFRHARIYKGNNSHLFLGISSNNSPKIWSDTDTGIVSSAARVRFRDAGASSPIGLMYQGTSPAILFAETYDNGKTFGTVTTLGFTGSYFDFDQGQNGFRWFYGVQNDSGTYNIYLELFDLQMNVVRSAVKTNLIGVDNAPIAVRMSYDSAGTWRMGILYSSGGELTTAYAKDGENFS